jgi:hypothetical protein
MTVKEAAQAAVVQVVCTRGRDAVCAPSLESEVKWLITWYRLFQSGNMDAPNSYTKKAFLNILKENNVE